MLKDIKEKEMVVCSIIVLLMIIIVVLFTDKKDISYKEPIVKNEEIMALFDNITNNYTLSIEENINNTIERYMYYNDSVIELYEKDESDIGYLKYNNNNFSIIKDTYELKKVDEIDFIKNEYYNMDFLKKIIGKCEFKFNNSYSVNCKLKKSDYYSEYNKMYNTNYGNEGSDEIDIYITYGSRIQSIKIDYTINNDIKVYNLEFINIGKTDFSDIREYYKEVLN